MAEYQRIEYRINKEGKIIEKVLNATGSNCIETTKHIETVLLHPHGGELGTFE